MNLPNEAPRLPLWPFLAGDAILLLAAWLIADQAPSPLDTATLAAVALLVGIGACVVLIPLLLNYTRRQDMLLIERQNQIAALARDTAATAEQVSIAVASLHGIAESATRLLKHADQLPARLQEKINEFKTQLNEVSVSENEALAQEINTLRASETERLETALTAIRDAAVELTALEAAARQHAIDTRDALASTVASVRERGAALAAGQLLAEKKLSEAQTAAAAALERAVDNALARLDAKLAAFSALKFEPPASPAKSGPPDKPAQNKVPPPPPAATGPDSSGRAVDSPASAEPSPGDKTAPVPAETAGPPKPAAAKAATTAPAESAPRRPPSSPLKTFRPPPPPPPPAAPDTASNSPAATSPDDPQGDDDPDMPEPASVEPAALPEPVAAATQPSVSAPAKSRPASGPKRRPSPRDLAPDEALPGLDLPPPDEFDQEAQDAPELSAAVSADGITRLIVTAYIGIGNKLHIRGDGPGLSWDKGAPLQFISIGKWRWESPDADAPINFKLYKNDEIECSSLGRQTLRPGYQHEVPANF